jgi:aminoglycoside phosphotransferase (APT) family kinase protein
MRAEWSRERAPVRLSTAAAQRVVRRVVPGARVLQVRPVSGGLSNTNLRIDLVGEARPLRARLYERGVGPARLERYCLERLRNRVPVPTVRYFAARSRATGTPLALLDWVDGEPLERWLPEASAARARAMGEQVGRALAGIHAVRFPRAGLLDGLGRVVEPFPVGACGLTDFLRGCLDRDPARTRAGKRLAATTLELVAAWAPALDAAVVPPCLVHGDFGGSNVLVRDGPVGPEVAAVLDWEYAHSGSPLADFGNLLRPPVGEHAPFVAGVRHGYLRAGGRLPPRWRPLSRLVDLTAWAEFLSRPGAPSVVIRDARSALRRTVLTGAGTRPGSPPGATAVSPSRAGGEP